ncbi:hypothetical protein FDI81_gp58 [Streptomyces phage Hydra]|uniref:Uncharacterized protein n=4 Tax=Likavirus TaxID=1982880 RepID=A0A291AWR4_9CAUD|nr:hypothetical protein AVT22_gp55 [Streptomyces phage Caliburn]YP_009616556.1 hypothetical protein FDI81_gp58 [Streptomyces phage Hydra]ATE84934.1 hypothetical protein SEA_BEARDEDLADY_56 [Streptomyces phage BeardedLady]ATE85459.1 hypothetical protein SEA_OZZIE_55 [Streptomyces phage Ozzie]UJQ86473.1 hypothetical protein SEA_SUNSETPOINTE_55 [Streptomyces phage SunsetPointe]URQ04969.1 hypothetical protein SEA_LEGACY_55 [Streptomyces phage Legacy]AKY03365.1 hypothetical protein SEA_CALIBURN_55 
MTTLNEVAEIQELPVGSKIVDADGDTGEKLTNGEWWVPGFGMEDSWFFTLPVEVEHEPHPKVESLTDLEALPDGTLIVGLDPQKTLRFKQAGQWVDPHKPLGTTWGLNTYVLARRYGVRVVATPA